MPFYMVTIERGMAPIEVPPVNEYLLNFRFGLVAALPAAILIGYLLSRLPVRPAVAVSVLVIVGLTALSINAFRTNNLVTVREASQHQLDQVGQAEVADYLHLNTTGPILLNLVGNERVAFPVIDRVIYEGSRRERVNIWPLALHDPRAVGATVVVMRVGGKRGVDDVFAALHDSPTMAAYSVVFENDDYKVYQLNR
jgi:hypothetical protein